MAVGANQRVGKGNGTSVILAIIASYFVAIALIAALAGIPFHVQALGKAPATRIGNFSRRLDLRVQ